MLDSWLPGRPERPLCTVPTVYLDGLEFRKEQAGCKEPAAAYVATRGSREAGGGERRLRLAGIRETHKSEDMGRGIAAERHALSLSESAQASDAVDRRVTGPAKN